MSGYFEMSTLRTSLQVISEMISLVFLKFQSFVSKNDFVIF